MNRILFASLAAIGAAGFTGCAVTDGQSSVGAYVDDAAITTQVKAKLAEDPTVSAMRISVETLEGTVQLAGFATNESEKARAAQITRNVNGVKNIRNNIIVRPPGS
jgi:hyperosmotically inducible periplasmic protein